MEMNYKEQMTAVLKAVLVSIIKNPISSDGHLSAKGKIGNIVLTVTRETNSENFMPFHAYVIRDVYGYSHYTIPMSEYEADEPEHKEFANLLRNAVKACDEVKRDDIKNAQALFAKFTDSVIK